MCKLVRVQYLKTGIFRIYKQICPSCGAIIGIDSKREEYEESGARAQDDQGDMS